MSSSALPGDVCSTVASSSPAVDALGADGVEVQDRFALEVGTSFAVARELAGEGS
jgi:hypothetical protein